MHEEQGSTRLSYTGKIQPKPGEIDGSGQILYPYLCEEEMAEAVDLAIYLKRPLLIKGEPGSGKTRLAHAVAYELGLPYESWHIKSISRAQDGLYTYDTVGRLRDANLAAARSLKENDALQIDDPTRYIRWGPLGRSFRSKRRTVVLIDKIDKADIDFPNDLLLELDELRFIVEETGEQIQAQPGMEPIVFITSNDEKDLPDAFLRRCLFYYVKFPDTERLKEIVLAHFPSTSQELVNMAVKRFQELREEMRKARGEVGKKVSTSELIDWFRVLSRRILKMRR